jgi:hypothetical protein
MREVEAYAPRRFGPAAAIVMTQSVSGMSPAVHLASATKSSCRSDERGKSYVLCGANVMAFASRSARPWRGMAAVMLLPLTFQRQTCEEIPYFRV